MGAGCRARHLSLDDALTAALLVTPTLSAPVEGRVVEAALDNARRVYAAVRRATGSCRRATIREAAQLLYDTATLRAAGVYSGVVAAALAYALLRLNGLAASVTWLLRAAAQACRDPDAATPEDIAGALEAVVAEGERRRPPASAGELVAALLGDERARGAFSEALEACRGGA